jgi:hypothetical protein
MRVIPVKPRRFIGRECDRISVQIKSPACGGPPPHQRPNSEPQLTTKIVGKVSATRLVVGDSYLVAVEICLTLRQMKRVGSGDLLHVAVAVVINILASIASRLKNLGSRP